MFRLPAGGLLDYLVFESFALYLFTLTYLSMFRLPAGGLLVPWAIIRTVVNSSELAWFI